MKLGYVLIYVADVPAAVHFYERAFGLAQRFATDDGKYAELETGATALGFVARDFAETNLPPNIVAPLSRGAPAPAVEIALVTGDIPAAVARATAAGAELVAAPKQKPWGQTVAYVRDLDGVLVELCTPMAD
jgi:catechol 2,3-dioxygenase-like lactoylglutathione lyase family enzyme